MEYTVNKDELIKLLDEAILLTVRETISELKKTGYLRKDDKQVYKSVSRQLRAYFGALLDGEPADPEMTRALDAIIDDDYFPVLLYYYQDGYTIEKIAEIYDCEVSTITRNKKRLCLTIDNYLF